MKLTSLDIMHYVILASILEPLPEKEGCTTRRVDWQEKSKLEYFLISGVNIGRVFYELSERIKENNYKQPKVIYDLAYKAQKESLKNRNGGKINFGIIELMIPIIATQIIEQRNDVDVLDLVENTLKKTTQEDVKYFGDFRELGRSVSQKFVGTELHDAKNLYDYYKADKGEYGNSVHKEYLTKFERIKEVYKIMEENYKEGNLLDTTVIAYNSIIEKCNNFYGLAADYICIAIYFYLINHPDVVIV